MTLNLKNEGGDKRGKILFLTHNNTKINLFEIKRGFSRGGHYHSFNIVYILLSGKVEYREFNIKTNIETLKILNAPMIINNMAHTANLITAIDDSLFVEIFSHNYEAKVYPKYRKIVEERLESK